MPPAARTLSDFKDGFAILQPGAILGQAGFEHGGSGAPPLFAGIGKEHFAAGVEITRHHDVQQATLPAVHDLRCAFDDLRPAIAYQQQPPGAFRHKNPAVRQKVEGPGNVQPLDHGQDLHWSGLCLDRRGLHGAAQADGTARQNSYQ